MFCGSTSSIHNLRVREDAGQMDLYSSRHPIVNAPINRHDCIQSCRSLSCQGQSSASGDMELPPAASLPYLDLCEYVLKKIFERFSFTGLDMFGQKSLCQRHVTPE